MLEANYIPPDEAFVFEYQGKNYMGKLSKVPGAGYVNVWFLLVNNYYWGKLSYTDKWIFNNQKNDMQEFAEFFGRHVVKSVE